MEINWRAVGYGFVATVILGVLSGITLPYTSVTLPTISHGLVGLVGGVIAGYMTIDSARSGALNGFVATVIGGLIILGILAVVGTLVAGLIGLSIALFALFILALSGIPGAVGGYIGAWLRGRRAARETRRVAPR